MTRLALALAVVATAAAAGAVWSQWHRDRAVLPANVTRLVDHQINAAMRPHPAGRVMPR